MKEEKEKKTLCANKGCGRPAEEGHRFCASCGLEWALFRRDKREEDIRGDGIFR